MSDTPITPTVGALVLTGVAPTIRISFNGVASFESLTAFGVVLEILAPAGQASFRPLTASGTLVEVVVLEGRGSFAPLRGHEAGFGFQGSASFAALTAIGYVYTPFVGHGTFAALRVKTLSGYTSFRPLRARGTVVEALSAVYSAYVMNTRNAAVTEYTNYEFNSFAKIGDSYYGAGPAGLVRLDGATDNSANIGWTFRTGQIDDKNPGLKRLPEVLLGLRTNGPVRVRVHYSDTSYYDYMLPSVKTNTIHQHRVKVGKGMRSRYFAVELQGVSNSTLELDSMQIEFSKTTRRLG